jgi:hypothetical protein
VNQIQNTSEECEIGALGECPETKSISYKVLWKDEILTRFPSIGKPTEKYSHPPKVEETDLSAGNSGNGDSQKIEIPVNTRTMSTGNPIQVLWDEVQHRFTTHW